ncbi:MAG TPA: VOC family protein [Streptosporangiaceae bacterium]|nr:VOC family protein [Streptosporangiaceae bacterium]
MTLKLASLTWDAHEPSRLARFWAAALGWDIHAATHGRVSLLPMDGTRFAVVFVTAAEEKEGANRIHLDLSSRSVEDQRATVSRLIGLGASEIDIGQGPDADHFVLVDPEGNEFCVLEPGNNFVSRASLLGSLTCDGTRTVGYFWSAALGWPLVWDQGDETAIRAPDGAGQFITWGGPPLPPKRGQNRLRLAVAPPPDGDQRAEVERLVSLGARRIGIGQGEPSGIVMADPDDNEFCVLAPS